MIKNISIKLDEFEEYYKNALEKIRRDFEFPGFRKGTVPEKMIEEKIGENKILEKTTEIAINKEWKKILEDLKNKDVQAIGHPTITITKIAKGNPLEFTIEFSVIEKIVLPDYKKMAKEILKEKKEIEVTEEEILKNLEYIKDNAKKEHEHNEENLKNAVIQNLKIEKEFKNRGELRMKILDEICNQVKIELPEILVKSELEKMIVEYKENLKDMGLKWEDYLKSIKENQKENSPKIESEDDLKKLWENDAEKRAKYGLVLRQIAKEENLTPQENILEKETENLIKNMTEEEKKHISKDGVKEYLFGKIRNNMVFDFLEKQQ